MGEANACAIAEDSDDAVYRARCQIIISEIRRKLQDEAELMI